MSLTVALVHFAKIFLPFLIVKCVHDKVRPDVEQAYCPDCGKLIKNEWYITRCSCCGVKMRAMVKNGEVVPQEHFCSNCGSEDFTVEKVDKINFIDINFAALVKTEAEEETIPSVTKCWQERTPEPPKLLVQYL
jgi:hypothetical protein